MAHISNLAGIRSSAVKDVSDLYVVKGGVFSPVQSAWLVKNNALVKVFERRGVPVTMSFVSPSPTDGESMVAGAAKTWKVKVPTVDGLVPTGTITFTGPQGNAVVSLDANGEAATTYTHNPGMRTVSAVYASTNGYTASSISRTITIQAAESDMYFVSPNYDQAYYGASNVTYRVRMTSVYGVLPTGQVKFTGPNSQVLYGDIWHGQEGGVWYAYAERTLNMPLYQRTVTAELVANNDFWARSETWRVRVLTQVQRQQWQILWYESAKNYAGASDTGTTAGNNLYSGDFGNISMRCFTRQNLPSKPNAGAYCVQVKVNFSMLADSALVRVGWHDKTTLPNSGSYSQGGIYQDKVGVSWVVANTRYTVDATFHFYEAMNNGWFKGLVFGGPAVSTPFSNVWRDPTVDVLWEWYEWVDT